MNGKLLFRRSASMVLASSFLTIAACSVELGGLFDGDAGSDVTVQRDGGPDADAIADRASDGRADTSIDTTTEDTSRDVSTNDGGGDTARDVGIDADAAREASLDADAASDASLDGDTLRDVSSDDGAGDPDGGRDIAIEPVQDATAEDTVAEPSVDVAIEPTIDVVADASPDASGDDADAAPPGTCGGGCNTFDDIGQTITRTVDQGPAPPMTGGTILDGTYVATSIVQYNGDSSAFSLSETSIISGNIDAWVASTNGQAPVRYTTTFTTSNNQMAFVFCCPVPGNLTITYTTDGATISNVDPANPNRVITYTRQ